MLFGAAGALLLGYERLDVVAVDVPDRSGGVLLERLQRSPKSALDERPVACRFVCSEHEFRRGLDRRGDASEAISLSR